MKSDEKITHSDAAAFAEAVAQYIHPRDRKLPGCLEVALNRHKTDEMRERRHARILRTAAGAIGIAPLVAARVAHYREEAAKRNEEAGQPRDAEDSEGDVCSQTAGLDSAITRTLATMDETAKIAALGRCLTAVAEAAL